MSPSIVLGRTPKMVRKQTSEISKETNDCTSDAVTQLIDRFLN